MQTSFSDISEGIVRIVLTNKGRLPLCGPIAVVLFFLLESSGRHFTGTAFHAFWPHRLEPRFLQDESQEAFVRAFARQLQPHLCHPYLDVLVLTLRRKGVRRVDGVV